IGDRSLSCKGDSAFDLSSQYLVGKLDCGDGTNVSVTLNVKEIEIASYLQGGLASAKLGVYLRKASVGPAKSIFNGAIDIKKLN
ncbi:MAG: hypothetical protein H7256_10235, partial [Bdellovibrio sp.]|nr:hypothetical protein [Bdellovibrio sp.]